MKKTLSAALRAQGAHSPSCDQARHGKECTCGASRKRGPTIFAQVREARLLLGARKGELLPDAVRRVMRAAALADHYDPGCNCTSCKVLHLAIPLVGT